MLNIYVRFFYFFSFFIAALSFSALSFAKDFSQEVTQRPSKLNPENVAVVFNENDPNSIEIAKYYLQARQIPKKNLIAVNLPYPSTGTIGEEAFNQLNAKINKHLNDQIQVIVLMWTKPYAVSCNSITSALTMGLDSKLCLNACAATASKNNPYFNSMSLNPYQDHQLRLSMLLPTDSVPVAKSLIDRGVLSSFSLNQATGYFLKTSDPSRSKPREPFFPKDLSTIRSKKLFLRSYKAEHIEHKKDVMFYFTGQANVKFLDTINFLPGAVGDHLTSHGGILESTTEQMISTKWIEAGATGSYGTVTEPCNYWQKFPNPQVMISHYLAGETLIEAYWKSVKWPAQGLFIGEPLAAPYQKIDLSPEPELQTPNKENNEKNTQETPASN